MTRRLRLSEICERLVRGGEQLLCNSSGFIEDNMFVRYIVLMDSWMLTYIQANWDVFCDLK